MMLEGTHWDFMERYLGLMETISWPMAIKESFACGRKLHQVHTDFVCY